jgi:HEAT repeat-containing protein 5
VALLTLSLSSLVDASEVFPSIIRTDLHACILHIFATILGTGSCQATVVPQFLPILKRFVTSLSAHSGPHGSDSSTQLRATLHRFLAILKQAQKRETEASLPCEKNTILASTLLLSSAGSAFDANDLLIKRFVDELMDCLGSRMTSKVAAGCCRSLLLLPKKGPAETALASHLLPQVLSFLANPSDVEGLEESRATLAQAAASLVSTFSTPSQKQTAMKLIVPALLERANREGARTYSETATKLLELAGVDAAAFKAVVAGMNAEQKSFMETVIKSGGVASQGRAKDEQHRDSGEPSIALKMDFGA